MRRPVVRASARWHTSQRRTQIERLLHAKLHGPERPLKDGDNLVTCPIDDQLTRHACGSSNCYMFLSIDTTKPDA